MQRVGLLSRLTFVPPVRPFVRPSVHPSVISVGSCSLPAEYGVYALAGSVLLTMMGVSLMFEKNLIRLGNVRRQRLFQGYT